MTLFQRLLTSVVGFLFLGAVVAYAQDASEKSTFVKFVEEQISTDNFKVRLNGLEGTLSSDITLSSITLADAKGVWLTFEKPRLVWSRLALLRGKLDIKSLTAERIEYLRNPEPDESLPSPEAGAFKIPDLPVSVILEKLNIGSISIAREVFGLKADVSANGKAVLDEGSLAFDLNIERLDGPRGGLLALANYSAKTKNLKLDIKLHEPADGIIANILNLEGRPPVALSIIGNAPISDLAVELGFDVEDRRILTGDLKLDRGASGLLANAQLAGPLASILPERHRAFFGQSSDLSAYVLFDDSGAIDLKKLSLKSGVMNLNANAYRLADGFLSSMQLQFSMKGQKDERVQMPVPNADTSLSALTLDVNYDAATNENWQARLRASGFKQKDVEIDNLNITADGNVANLNLPDNRKIEFDLSGLLQGFSGKNAAVSEAFGSAIQLAGNGSWQSKQPLVLDAFKIAGESFSLTTTGKLTDYTYDGDTRLEAQNLAAFGALTGRDLKGQASLSAQGIVKLLTGGFDLKMAGTTIELGIGEPRVNRLLDGETTVSGGIARDEQGITFRKLRVANQKLEAELYGRFSSKIADVEGKALIRNLASLSEEASGPLKLELSVNGQQAPFVVNANLNISSGRLQKRSVENLLLSFKGTTTGNAIAGKFSSSGTLAGKPVLLSASLDANADLVSLQKLDAKVGATRIYGNLKRFNTGLLDAGLNVNSTDISDIAALVLANASGSINGSVELFNIEQMQGAKTKTTIGNIRYQDYQIGSANVVASIVDLFGKPRIGATIDGVELRAAGVDVESLKATIRAENETTTFDLRAGLRQNNVRLEASGRFTQPDETTDFTLANLSLTSDITDARLQAPARIVLGKGQAEVSSMQLRVGTGSVRLDGTFGDRLKLNVNVTDFPLTIVNTIRPETRASGTISGQIDVVGIPSDPAASFQLDGRGINLAQLSDANVTPLSISARGRFADNALRLDDLQVQNAQNINISVSGSLPMRGGGLDIRASGTAPLNLAENVLKSRGASVDGNASFNIVATNSLQTPRLSGNVSIQGAKVTDPLSNLQLTNIGLRANLNGDRLSISSGSANLSRGGRVTITGSIGIMSDLPADLRITLANARYTDGQLFEALASGRLTVTGPLLGNPTLGGTIDLGRAEIMVPENLVGNTDLLEVKHVRPSAMTKRTLTRLDKANPTTRPTSRTSILRLDLTINAPNQIFVRGRGLDAELGGRIRITGPVNDVQPVGRFELRRGRLSILGQRIDLVEGAVSLTGDLDPTVDLLARTKADDIDAFIRLKGRISDIEVTFYSLPELPQDEVLALIIFGHGIGKLSPSQIARLASIASELTGGNSPGLVDSIRKATGLDDIDIVQDDEGNAAVKAGKYINDKVYLGVEAGKKPKATINLDITDNVKARGGVSSEGDSSIGIFLERDY